MTHHCVVEWVGAIVQNGQSVESVGVCHPQPASPACNSIEDSTRHHRLIEDPEHSSADVEGPQAPQKIETTLALL